MGIKNEEVKNFMLDTEDEFTNIYETSLVNTPATGMNFLKFKDEKKVEHLTFRQVDVSGYQRMLSGVWFMPNTKYIRTKVNEKGENTFYTTEITEQGLYNALIKYLKSGNYDNYQIEHSGEYVNGFYTMEHWVYMNPQTVSPIFGLTIQDLGYSEADIKVGTVLKTVYVSDEKFWNEQVLTGNVNGFSIGALFGLKENLQSKSTLFSDVETENQKIDKNVETFSDIDAPIEETIENVVEEVETIENVEQIIQEKVEIVEEVSEFSKIQKLFIDTIESLKTEFKSEINTLRETINILETEKTNISKSKELLEETVKNQTVLLSQNTIPTRENVVTQKEIQKFKTKIISVGGKNVEVYDLG